MYSNPKCFPLSSFFSYSLISPLFCFTVWFNKLVITFLVIVTVGNYPGQMSSKEQEEGKEQMEQDVNKELLENQFQLKTHDSKEHTPK